MLLTGTAWDLHQERIGASGPSWCIRTVVLRLRWPWAWGVAAVHEHCPYQHTSNTSTYCLPYAGPGRRRCAGASGRRVEACTAAPGILEEEASLTAAPWVPSGLETTSSSSSNWTSAALLANEVPCHVPSCIRNVRSWGVVSAVLHCTGRTIVGCAVPCCPALLYSGCKRPSWGECMACVGDAVFAWHSIRVISGLQDAYVL